MFGPGVEADHYKDICDAVKRPLYGADCYAYALVASGFGADIVVEADLGLYDYCALVPVVEGAGGTMTDWNGNRLTLQNHEASKGRVIAAANKKLHTEAVQILRYNRGTAGTDTSSIAAVVQRHTPPLLAGIVIGFALCFAMRR
jgi:inositol-phosphate phosphatase/L-galactose 1-phosphate phosphatase/histidinol-phosphatase